MRQLLRRLVSPFRWRRMEADLLDELRFHRDMKRAELERHGLPPDEAAATASRAMGNALLAREDARGIWIWAWLDSTWQDIRHAWRSTRQHPMVPGAVVLTLAVGIGANTAIFSVLYQALIRPLPYPDADRLVFVWNTWGPEIRQTSVSIPDYLDRKTQAPAVADAALVTEGTATLAENGPPEQLSTLAVTPSLFSTLARQPFLGRAFDETDAVPGADQVVILTYGLWASRFASDPSVIGRTVRLSGEPHRVVGVLPADFHLPFDFAWPEASLLVPFAFTPRQMSDEERGNEYSLMIARLRPAATVAQLNEQMQTIVDRNLERLPQVMSLEERSGFGGVAVPMQEQLAGHVRKSLLVLQIAVLVLLLIACANMTNLLLIRATARAREMAVRTALGAGRGRLLRQSFVEALVWSVLGGAGGLIVGAVGLRVLLALAQGGDQIPGYVGTLIHPPVVAVSAGLLVATSLLFGLAPGLAAMAHPASLLSSTRASAGRRSGQVRAALVVAQTALALVLLVSAGLLLRSFARLLTVDAGFSPSRVLTAHVSLSEVQYPDAAAVAAFWTRLLDAVHALPGVAAAGVTTSVPLTGTGATGSYRIVGMDATAPDGGDPNAYFQGVGGDYFRAMRIPLLAGRLFDDTGDAESPRVVVIDQLLARRYFPDRSPLGQQIGRGPTAIFTIVGVVGTINHVDLAETVTRERIYYPDRLTRVPSRELALVIRAGSDPRGLVAPLRDAVQGIDPELPLADVRTMESVVVGSLGDRRTPMLLLAGFGVVALALAAMGLYSVLAFSVSQRARELGIRQALGADARAILGEVMMRGVRSVGAGIALGLLATAAMTRYLQGLLFGVRPMDLATIGVVSALLVAAALLASYIPARRATRVDPLVALRYE